ncbi:MAG: hypothetical protein E7438_00380, partial [Ruminococcaceae bacterium]|nr:hypothetical protein [Oscillospiraceae bacterium]
NTNTARIALTKAGTNLIEVRYTDLGGSKWTATEVYAYTVIYDTRSVENGTITEYLAMGDTMLLPSELEQPGYSFTGWYTAPDAAAGNGAVHTDTQFNATGTVILYGNWTARTYYIEFVGLGEGVTNITENETLAVVYKTTYKLPVPVNPDAEGEFVGWYTGPGASGTPLTDSMGNCFAEYDLTRDTPAYPFYDTGVLTYVTQADGTYGVTQGPSIRSVASVRIPEYYKGVEVTIILENAFAGVGNLERLDIPATIRSIGVGAIPNSNDTFKEINVYTNTVQQNYEIFYSSHDGALLRHDMGTVYLEIFPRGKTGEYVIPDHVNVIRDKVFRYSKITHLTVGTGVAEIMPNAFYSCNSLETLEFKTGGTNSLTIDPEAFYRTANLKTLRLPARLAEMDLQMLNQFVKLQTLEIEEGGNQYSTRNNMICNDIGDTILYVTMSVSGEYEIPLGIRHIGPKAFANRPNLTKLTIPAYVTSIGISAFEGCTGITELEILGGRNDNLQILNRAFAGCSNITTVTFRGAGKTDKGLTVIGDSAFEGLAKLRNIVFEAGTRISIGYRSFAANNSLSSLVFTDGARIESIGAEAFAGCTALAELTIPADTTSVGDGAFSGCTALWEVSFAPYGKQISFGVNVFGGCTKLSTVNLPASITSFDGSVFSGCDALRQIEVDPANRHLVSYEGALYTKDYEEILFYPKALDGDLSKLHPDMRKIGNTVFQGNTKITKVTIGKNVTEIGAYAFDNCFNITEVVFENPNSAMVIGDNAFARCTKLATILLPTGTTAIGASAFEEAGLESFTIPAGIKELPAGMLKKTKITSIVIPAAVETIGDGAFASTALTSVTFEDGDKPLTIGTLENSTNSNGVFYGTKFTEFAVPNRAVRIGAYAFSNQTSLKTVTMGENSQLTVIGKNAFAYANALTSVTLGAKLETIGENAFYNTKITKVHIPASVTMIDYRAFSTTSLTNVTFELEGTAELTIMKEAFYNARFKEIVLPARLTKAYDRTDWNGKSTFKNFADVFKGNTSLKVVDVEPGGEYFTSIDGVVYELNVEGVPEILLYCPPAKNGELTVPKEVRKVENGAFYKTKLSTIRFEEYDTTDANYGEALLEIGNTTVVHDSQCPGETYAVFSPAAKITVYLPSHLAVIGLQCFYGLKNNTQIIFNQDAHLRSIEDSAFKDCAYLTELIIPSVDRIGACAFYGCKKLAALSIGKDSQYDELPLSVFNGCTALTAFEVPATVTSIGTWAFKDCSSLASITFAEGSSLRFIGSYAFSGTAISEFQMPDSVLSISEGIFSSCENLKTVKLSRNLTSLGSDMHLFFMAPNLETVIIPENSRNFKMVDGVIYDLAETILYYYPKGKDPTGFKIPNTVVMLAPLSLKDFPGAELVLPEGLENIGDYALHGAKITSIRIPASVKQISYCAFINCLDLQTVTFAENSALNVIEDSAFSGCTALKSANLPDNLRILGGSAFSGCKSLTEVILPAALSNLERYAFRGCSGLTKFVMQEGLEFIEGNVLSDENTRHYALEEITIPSTVREIGQSAFAYHTGLKRVYFAEGSQLTFLAYGVFNKCTSLESIALPASLTTLQEATISGVKRVDLFNGCTSLKNVDMSACTNITVWPSRMFDGCTSLETLLLPESLLTINSYAAYGLTGLKEIVIPARVTEIGGYAFDGCTSLEKVTFAEDSQMIALGVNDVLADNPDWGIGIFANTTALQTIILPEGLLSIGVSCFENSGLAYFDMPVTVRTIASKAFKNCDNLVNADLSPELLYLGDEAFFDCDMLEKADVVFGLEYLGAYAFAYSEKLQKAYIPASISSIAGNPYMGCSGIQSFELDPDSTDFREYEGVLYNVDMTVLLYYPASLTAEVFTFPETVREIAPGAFAGAQMKNFVVPEQILEIPDYAFSSAAIESITFHPGVQSVGAHAFEGCQNLNNVAIPYTVKEIGDYAFANCTGLTNFSFEEIPATVEPTKLGTHLLDGCTGITELILHDRMTSIPSYMFANTSITNVVIPRYITNLTTEGVFYGCKLLETAVFEELKYTEKTSLGNYFFYGCEKLKEMSIPYYVTAMGAYAFAYCTSLETVNVYSHNSSPTLGGTYCFYMCSNLTTINAYPKLQESNFVRDENGTVVAYKNLSTTRMSNFPARYCFVGCYKLNLMDLYDWYDTTFMENVLAGYPNRYIILTGPLFCWQTDESKTGFANAPDLKEVWIDPTELDMTAATFVNVAGELTVYFYNHTYEEIKAKESIIDTVMADADPRVTFYFKDTMPEDVQWPPELQSEE